MLKFLRLYYNYFLVKWGFRKVLPAYFINKIKVADCGEELVPYQGVWVRKRVAAMLENAQRALPPHFALKVVSGFRNETEQLALREKFGNKQQVAVIFKPNQRFKKVQIVVSRDIGKKASYTIRLIYGKHEKTLPIRRGVRQADSVFAERCAVTGLSVLKAPCRVSFILPDELLASLCPVEAGFIFGDELVNLVSRHIVNFTDMRDEYDFSNASKV